MYHRIKETTIVSESSYSYLSNNNSGLLFDLFLSRHLICKPLDDLTKHITRELPSTTKDDNFLMCAQSPICLTTIVFDQNGDIKQIVKLLDNICIKCTNENFISVKRINY